MGILVKGNIKEGVYKLIKTTNGWVLDGEDIAYAGVDEPLGEWMLECDAEGEGDNLYRCSECERRYGCQEYDLPNFCPNCGARMKGADDELVE